MEFLSFRERRYSPKGRVSPKFPSVCEESIIVTETVEENGRVISKNVCKTQAVKDKFNGLRVTDFCLENVMASGAIETLRPVQLSGAGLSATTSLISNLEIRAAKFDEMLAAALTPTTPHEKDVQPE